MAHMALTSWTPEEVSTSEVQRHRQKLVFHQITQYKKNDQSQSYGVAE